VRRSFSSACEGTASGYGRWVVPGSRLFWERLARCWADDLLFDTWVVRVTNVNRPSIFLLMAKVM
jgi:hypothetical protein